jgi:hypothetical protein
MYLLTQTYADTGTDANFQILTTKATTTKNYMTLASNRCKDINDPALLANVRVLETELTAFENFLSTTSMNTIDWSTIIRS